MPTTQKLILLLRLIFAQMNKYVHSFFVICICFLACKQQHNLNKGITLILPKNIEIYEPLKVNESSGANAPANKLKIYTVIDVSCATCLLKFEKWEAFKNEMSISNNVKIIPVCISTDKFEMLKFLFENKKLPNISFALMLDIDRRFLEDNKKLIDGNNDLTVLVNTDNEVLLSGNPNENEMLKSDYIKIISKNELNNN